MYIALILRPNTPCALLDIRSLPLLGVNRWAAAIVSGDLRFQATAAVTSTGKSTGRESPAFNASVFLSARLGRAFALLMAIINNSPYEDYKIITSILTSECLSGGVIEMASCVFHHLAPDLRNRITSIMPKFKFQVKCSSDW